MEDLSLIRLLAISQVLVFEEMEAFHLRNGSGGGWTFYAPIGEYVEYRWEHTVHLPEPDTEDLQKRLNPWYNPDTYKPPTIIFGLPYEAWHPDFTMGIPTTICLN